MASPKIRSKGKAAVGENDRRLLAKATTRYFESLSSDAMAEERSMAESLHRAAAAIDIDSEP
jgi:hypothetical protein